MSWNDAIPHRTDRRRPAWHRVRTEHDDGGSRAALKPAGRAQAGGSGANLAITRLARVR